MKKISHIRSKKHVIYAMEGFVTMKIKKEFKLYQKVRDHCHYTGKFRGAAHSICNLCYKVPKNIPVVFHNGSIYDYHFIIEQLAKESEGQFECLGENTEKYISFSVPIEKEVITGYDEEDDNIKEEEENDSDSEEESYCNSKEEVVNINNNNDKRKKITYKLKFIDSYTFMQSKLSNRLDNLSGIFNKECKKCHERKKIRAECKFIGFRNNRFNYRYKECNEAIEAIKNFPNLLKFCNGDLDNFFCLFCFFFSFFLGLSL